MKHSPFKSEYRLDFEVVEERLENVSIYPHREQLPVLLRALKQDFAATLPARIARVDERANDFDKLQRLVAVDYFCHFVNASRSDGLQLFNLLDLNRVAHVAIVQQVTMHTPRGPLHHFRFYAGERVGSLAPLRPYAVACRILHGNKKLNQTRLGKARTHRHRQGQTLRPPRPIREVQGK